MKKIYKEPKIKVVRVSGHQMLCSSPWKDPDVESLDITDDEEDDEDEDIKEPID